MWGLQARDWQTSSWRAREATPSVLLVSVTMTNSAWQWENMGVCSVAQSCLTLCDPMDCSPPGSSVYGIFQARILEWIAISSSRGIFLTQGLNWCLLCLLHWQVDSLPLSHLGSPVGKQPWKIIGCIPVKLDLQKQVAGLGHGSLTSGMGHLKHSQLMYRGTE